MLECVGVGVSCRGSAPLSACDEDPQRIIKVDFLWVHSTNRHATMPVRFADAHRGRSHQELDSVCIFDPDLRSVRHPLLRLHVQFLHRLHIDGC